MSDHDQETQRRRASKFASIALGIEIEAELRDSKTVQSILAATEVDAWDAMRLLSDVSPTDTNAVSRLLVQIRTFVYIRNTLATIRRRAMSDEAELRAEDHPREGE